MSRKNIRRPLSLQLPLLLFLQTLAIATLAIPLTNPVSLLNDTIKPTASTPLEELVPQNATSPSLPKNRIDYRIIGTPVVLRITETGGLFYQITVETIIDGAIRRVVNKINTGFGSKPIEHGKFSKVSANIEMCITALANEQLTYFLLGDVLAGIWQYMNEPWSGGFREVVFDILVGSRHLEYIGYGRIYKFGPVPPPPPPEPSLSPNTNPALNETE